MVYHWYYWVTRRSTPTICPNVIVPRAKELHAIEQQMVVALALGEERRRGQLLDGHGSTAQGLKQHCQWHKTTWVCLKIVYPETQWLMIIIPIKWL